MNTKIRRQLLLLAVCFAIALVVYSAIKTWAGITDFGALFDRFSGYTLTKILLFSICAYTCRFIAWHLNLVYLGAKVPIIYDLQCYLAGYLFLPTPARAGTSIRIFYLRQYVPYSISFIGLILERINDLVATIIFALFLVKNIYYWILIIPILFLLFKSSKIKNNNNLTLKLSKYIEKVTPNFLKEKVSNLLSGIKETMKTKPALLSSPAFISSQILFCLAYISYGLVVHTALTNFDINIPYLQVISIYSASVFVSSISFLPVGLGGAEVMMIIFLSLWGVTKVDAVAVTLISRLCTIWFIVFVGLISTFTLFISRKKVN